MVDVDITMREYISAVRRSDFNSFSVQDHTTSDTLLYTKDLSCPQEWQKSPMDEIMPPLLAYRGPNGVSKCDTKTPRVTCEVSTNLPLLSDSHSPDVAAEILMVYIGQHGIWYSFAGT